MPSQTGIWNQDEANAHHSFDYRLARFLAHNLPKNRALYDMGCGIGTYMEYFKSVGFQTVYGIEGEALKNFETDNIHVHDLTDPDIYDKVGGPKGNVICLEVAEHIPAEYTKFFLDNITSFVHPDGYGDLVLSWAIPHQEGIGHVNCLDNFSVIAEMRNRGFEFDVEKSLAARQNVSNHCAWFRNTLMWFRKK